jgi:exopolysaccharide production protein ExoQ
MSPSLATLICACGIAGLFYLGRDNTARTSKALWLPVIWIWIAGSRAVSVWLGVNPTGGNVQLDGSPLDAAIFGAILTAAIIVLIRRSSRTRTLLAANWPIVIYFVYCLISVAWSYHPDVSFKRWIKAIGDLVIVLVITTDPQPRAALERVFSRIGFLLLPASVLLIKYYGNLGVVYTPDGEQINTGVTTNKNMLGVMLLVISLGTLWHITTLVHARGKANRSRHLLAQIVLLAFGVALLLMANSATSTACFVLGGVIILATGLRMIRNQPARVHMLCLAIVLAGGLTLLFGGESLATSALGRNSNLTGRTEIWAAVIPAAPNSIVGAGFESFWISPAVRIFQRKMVGFWHPEELNEAHDGYIEVYLNLGWVGVCFISLLLLTGYKRAVGAFRLNPSIGGLTLAYIIAAAVYSITEAGFRMLDPIWIFLLLAVISASGVVAGFLGSRVSKIRASSRGVRNRTGVSNELVTEGEIVYLARPGLSQTEITRANNLPCRLAML